MGKNFLNVAVDSIGPFELLVRKSREIGLFSLEANGSVFHLDKVGNDMLDLLKVLLPWSNSET